MVFATVIASNAQRGWIGYLPVVVIRYRRCAPAGAAYTDASGFRAVGIIPLPVASPLIRATEESGRVGPVRHLRIRVHVLAPGVSLSPALPEKAVTPLLTISVLPPDAFDPLVSPVLCML